MTEQSREYWAFLSYSHADAGAARLHRALERYVLPRRLRQGGALPRRLFPVFRDTEELAAGNSLSARLRDALDRSRWLIVLCSPGAARSRHIAEEIDYFVSRHGAERVLCALMDGDLPASLPAPIRALPAEPLAADFRQSAGFQVALLKLVACIAGVPFAELRDRERQRRHRAYAAAAVGAGLLAAGAALSWDLEYRAHIDDFSGVTRRYGTWEGIGLVAADAAVPRYRFVRRGRLNPPRRVDYLGPDGACPRGGMENVLLAEVRLPICRADFEYAADGSIASELYDAEQAEDHGTAVGQVIFNGDQRQKIGWSQIWTYRNPGTRPSVHLAVFVRDAHGFDTTVRFMSAPGVPMRNGHGHFGYAYVGDPLGRVLSRALLDEKGAVIAGTERPQ